jgi:hypothetical protein
MKKTPHFICTAFLCVFEWFSYYFHQRNRLFLVMYVYCVVCFLLGNSPASEFYMPTFRNVLFHLHRRLWRWNRVFRNVGTSNSDAGELPRRKHTTLRTRRKFEICVFCEILTAFENLFRPISGLDDLRVLTFKSCVLFEIRTVILKILSKNRVWWCALVSCRRALDPVEGEKGSCDRLVV